MNIFYSFASLIFTLTLTNLVVAVVSEEKLAVPEHGVAVPKVKPNAVDAFSNVLEILQELFQHVNNTLKVRIFAKNHMYLDRISEIKHKVNSLKDVMKRNLYRRDDLEQRLPNAGYKQNYYKVVLDSYSENLELILTKLEVKTYELKSVIEYVLNQEALNLSVFLSFLLSSATQKINLLKTANNEYKEKLEVELKDVVMDLKDRHADLVQIVNLFNQLIEFVLKNFGSGINDSILEEASFTLISVKNEFGDTESTVDDIMQRVLDGVSADNAITNKSH